MISVCVPYWDRQFALDRMFANYATTYPDLSLEFSVCDDGSPVPAVVPPGVTLTRLPQKQGPLNPCVPINAAVAASTGEVIVLTNAEVEHRGPVLREMAELLGDPRDYVTAPCWDDRGFWVAHPTVRFDERGRLPAPPGGQFHFMAMFHRALWELAGGFDEDYRRGQGCDDNDWLWRLADVGARFRQSQTPVYHAHGKVRWDLPHNRALFDRKWPPERRRALG